MTAYIWGAIAFTIALIASPFFTHAQQPQAPTVPDYSITLNGQEWYLIGEALAERPFKQANPVLAKINQQITAIAQQRQKEEAEAAAKAKPAEPEKKPE